MHRTALFIFVAFWTLAAPAAAEAKRVALVVGIDVYDNLLPTQQLAKARNDAAFPFQNGSRHLWSVLE